MKSSIFHRARTVPLTAVMLLAAGAMLTGCVTPIPLAKEAPDLSYKVTRPMVVSVLDERAILSEGKPPTFIGRAHSVFGIPTDMQTYPWLVTDKEKKEQTLAQALQERIVVGLNDEGWQLTSADFTGFPTKDQVAALLPPGGAERLLVLSISQWFVSINLNWVGAFNFDWGYKLELLDAAGAVVSSITDSGRDVVDEKASESPQNMIKLAFRDRLIKILERPDVREALQK